MWLGGRFGQLESHSQNRGEFKDFDKIVSNKKKTLMVSKTTKAIINKTNSQNVLVKKIL